MIKLEIKKVVLKAIKKSQEKGELFEFIIPEIKIEHPEDKNFGDYSINIAMVLAKIVKKSPLEIAEIILKNIKKQKPEFFEKIEIKKPGFINFYLCREVLLENLNLSLKQKEKYGQNKEGKGKTMIIDYSSPNIAKAFGIGHLRSTIIGQAIYNIYKFCGWKCIGDNHLGDWGTQFGKLIVAIKKWGNIESISVKELEKLYVRFHKEVENNPEIEEDARKEFKNLENNEKIAKKIWLKCVQISLKEFDKIYRLLKVKIDYAFGESFYQPMLDNVIKEAIEKKVAKKSQGALIVEYQKNILPPAMLLKSDEATNYFTRDLATIKYRFKKWNPDLIIYEVGADQKLHLKQVFKAAELLNWAKENKFFHVAHGLIRTKTGKFSTRKGETIHLEDVLNEAILKAKEIINQSIQNNFKKEEKDKLAEIIGIGAVKYNDLSQHYSKDIVFDWDKVLNLKGNSAPYLQYTFARCQSVLRKSKSKININLKNFNKLDITLEEQEILREIYKFPEKVSEAAFRFSPNLICSFAFNLAQKYNLFYNSYPIIKAQNKDLKDFRLAITCSVAFVLKNSLSLMGISAPEKM